MNATKAMRTAARHAVSWRRAARGAAWAAAAGLALTLALAGGAAAEDRPAPRPAAAAPRSEAAAPEAAAPEAAVTLAARPPDAAAAPSAAPPAAPSAALRSSTSLQPAQAAQAPARGPVTNLPLPRFVSLKTAEGNVRRGPSLNHRIDWVYTRRTMPLEVTAEFGHWRRVRDRDGAGGWVHYALLSGVRTVLVERDMVALRQRPRADARILARAEAGVVARLVDCGPDWCRIAAEDGADHVVVCLRPVELFLHLPDIDNVADEIEPVTGGGTQEIKEKLRTATGVAQVHIGDEDGPVVPGLQMTDIVEVRRHKLPMHYGHVI